jgi:hypothetical protein
MMHSTWNSWARIGLLAFAVAGPAWSQPITVAPGNDGWVTPANGSQIDLSVFPIEDVFGPGSVVSPQVVTLSGRPLDPNNLGSIDTLLERQPPSVTFNLIPETQAFPVELKALRLVGYTNINGTDYELIVALSDTGSGAGKITATRLTPDGGRFDSTFPVVPKLVFTDLCDPANQVVIDCGLVDCKGVPYELASYNNCWEIAFGPKWFDPRVYGVTPIRPGIAVDGNYDGAPDYVTVGRRWAGFPGREFHVGYQPAPPWGPCGPSTHDHAVYSLTHIASKPNDCSDKPDEEVVEGVAKSRAKCGTPTPPVEREKLCIYDDVYGDIKPGDEPVEVKPVEGVAKKKSGAKLGKVPAKPTAKPKK